MRDFPRAESVRKFGDGYSLNLYSVLCVCKIGNTCRLVRCRLGFRLSPERRVAERGNVLFFDVSASRVRAGAPDFSACRKRGLSADESPAAVNVGVLRLGNGNGNFAVLSRSVNVYAVRRMGGRR